MALITELKGGRQIRPRPLRFLRLLRRSCGLGPRVFHPAVMPRRGAPGRHERCRSAARTSAASSGKAMEEALALAAIIASKPPVTLAIGKEAFYRQVEMSLADAYDYAAGVMVENMMHRESKEGIGAFLDKRPPDWDKA